MFEQEAMDHILRHAEDSVTGHERARPESRDRGSLGKRLTS